MEITPKNIINHELIGLPVEVIASTNSAQIGIRGKVIDETRNMLVIESDDQGIKKVAKGCAAFVFALAGVRVRVDGRLLVAQPENRIQKKVRG